MDYGIGVCYGRNGDNIPSPRETIELYKSNGIGAMRIYSPEHDTLDALRGTDIDLIMDAPNVRALSNESAATIWVRDNILPYRHDVSFKYIAVGNEVMKDNGHYDHILPAMKHIYNAIKAAGLQDTIKVSTAVKSNVLQHTFPPSRAEFEDPKHMRPIVQFLRDKRAPLLANIYPYFSHVENQRDVRLDYALFGRGNVHDEPFHYCFLFDAMVDSMHHALEKVGCPNVRVVVSETGWPSDRGVSASVGNAGTYNQNLINHVKRGTPMRPGNLETYIFAMFNENKKEGDRLERHFGLFKPNKEHVYKIKLR